jgi:DNA-binding CsgD family transcriptional regulator/PAS domain-containing protein
MMSAEETSDTICRVAAGKGIAMPGPRHTHTLVAAAIGSLYEAAAMSDLWPDALDALARAFASTAAHFFVWDRSADRATLSLPSRDYRGQEDFHRHYGRIDPRRHLLMRRPPGFLLLCHEHFSPDFVRASEFYNDFSLPLGRRWLMTTILWEDAAAAAIFALFRAPGQPPYTETDRRLFLRLLPDLRRAFRLGQCLRMATAEAALGRAVLDALPQAVLVTDAAGRIAHANVPAEALLRTGTPLGHRAGTIAAATPAETAALHAALRRAVEAAADDPHGPAASLVLHDATGARLALSIVPLACAAWNAGAPARLALVTATPLEPPRPDPAPLRMAFGFTGAEAELAAALAGGRRLDAVAADRGVRMPTVRSQLRAIFDKTGTSRQAELVRLLARLPHSTPRPQGEPR